MDCFYICVNYIELLHELLCLITMFIFCTWIFFSRNFTRYLCVQVTTCNCNILYTVMLLMLARTINTRCVKQLVYIFMYMHIHGCTCRLTSNWSWWILWGHIIYHLPYIIYHISYFISYHKSYHIISYQIYTYICTYDWDIQPILRCLKPIVSLINSNYFCSYFGNEEST
jgi:hypothetical protein